MSDSDPLKAWVQGIAGEIATYLQSDAAYAGFDLSRPEVASTIQMSQDVAGAAVALTLDRLADAGLLDPVEMLALAVNERGDAS